MDRVVWGGEKRGIFTVRSGYRLLLGSISCSSKYGQLRVPQKLELPYGNLSMHLCQLSLVYMENELQETLCLSCHLDLKNTNHVFHFCVFAKDVWVALENTTQVQDDQMSFHEWLSWMFDTYTTSKHTEISIRLWALWFARN